METDLEKAHDVCSSSECFLPPALWQQKQHTESHMLANDACECRTHADSVSNSLPPFASCSSLTIICTKRRWFMVTISARQCRNAAHGIDCSPKGEANYSFITLSRFPSSILYCSGHQGNGAFKHKRHLEPFLLNRKSRNVCNSLYLCKGGNGHVI